MHRCWAISGWSCTLQSWLAPVYPAAGAVSSLHAAPSPAAAPSAFAAAAPVAASAAVLAAFAVSAIEFNPHFTKRTNHLNL